MSWKSRNGSAMRLVLLAIVGITLGMAGCEILAADEDIACFFETRTTPCNSGAFGPWEQRCTNFSSENYDSPTDACINAHPSSDLHCQAGCCVRFEFRSVDPQSGVCP